MGIPRSRIWSDKLRQLKCFGEVLHGMNSIEQLMMNSVLALYCNKIRTEKPRSGKTHSAFWKNGEKPLKNEGCSVPLFGCTLQRNCGIIQ